jgi:multiple sugar transport system permease protein
VSVLTPVSVEAGAAPVMPGRGPGRLRLSRPARHRLIVGGLFLAPLVIGLLVFRLFGLVYNVYLSFTRTGSFGPSQWIGTENFRELLGDELFRNAVLNTVKFVVLGVPPIVVVSILCALLLERAGRGAGPVRTILFLPAVTLPVSTMLVFAWIFNTDHGIVNGMLTALGSGPVNWFGTNAGVTTVFVVVMTYTSCAVPMLIVLANLQTIDPMYYEAAALDGAGPLQVFRHVKLPLLTPSIFYVTTTNIISMFQMFSLVYVLLPDSSHGLRFGQTIVHYYYQNAFVYAGERGYAAAISLVLFAMILVVTLINFRLQKYWVHYDH